MSFKPNYLNIVKAARNIKPDRIPFYEHQISEVVISKIMNRIISDPSDYRDDELDEYFSTYCAFFMEMGYDTVSFERILSGIMPGNGALYGHEDGCIKTYDDFKKYPWDELPKIYFKENKRYFDALEKNIPAGMKAVGGVGNGIFECVQDITGYMNLCYIKVDDPELYGKLFNKMGEVLKLIWTEFAYLYKDLFCVMRMGDDLGFKTNTLLPPEDIIGYIIPGYKSIIDIIHSNNRPFLLHSCGNIFEIMESLIAAGIDAKHSNEDEIAKMDYWYEKYGDRIGNFGGIDADILCRYKEDDIRSYVTEIYFKSIEAGGVALGSGNSIPDYIPAENYLSMINVLKELRLS